MGVSHLRAFPLQPPGGAAGTEQSQGCLSIIARREIPVAEAQVSALTAAPWDLQQLASWVVLVSSSDTAMSRAPQDCMVNMEEMLCFSLFLDVSGVILIVGMHFTYKPQVLVLDLLIHFATSKQLVYPIFLIIFVR